MKHASLSRDSIRGCCHREAYHEHGTRRAYVADRCRCDACREANRRYAQIRAKAIAYGQWHPYVDAGPVREHLDRLRNAGIGIERLITLSGVGSGTVRRLIYGHRTTGLPAPRLRSVTADRLLSLHIPELETVADSRRSATETQQSQTNSSIAAADSDPEDIDEVAIDKAMQGHPGPLTRAEQREAIDRLIDQGRSLRGIAVLLGISARTVSRRRSPLRAVTSQPG